jgi:hypothetical protein
MPALWPIAWRLSSGPQAGLWYTAWMNLVGNVVLCQRCGDVDLGPWCLETKLCELCSSHRTFDRVLSQRIQAIARSETARHAAMLCGIEPATLFGWLTPVRLRSILIVAQAHWDRRQRDVASQCSRVDVAECRRLIATLREPWILGHARKYCSHWPL